MRILFVALTSPFPPNSGQRMKTWSLLQALARLGHSLTLLILTLPRNEIEDSRPMLDLCEHVEAIPAPPGSGMLRGDYLGRLATLLSPSPYGARRFRCPPLKQRVRELLSSGEFDAILCDNENNMQNLPEPLSSPVLLNKDDVGHLLARRYAQVQRNPGKWLYSRLESLKLRRFEREVMNRATLVLACSEFDRGLLQAICPEAHIVVAPNVIDTEKFMPAGGEEPSTVLYQGGMDWYPNQDAAEFFIGAVLPELRKLVPGVKFVAAGRDPSGSLGRRFAHLSDVCFTGAVPDMRDEIARAAVCVVPLRIGTGTRIKILEAAAMAKPIVSTRLGAEGLEFVDGKEIVLADDPSEFARRVADLMGDGDRRRALGKAARRRIEQQHSPTVLSQALRTALDGLEKEIFRR